MLSHSSSANLYILSKNKRVLDYPESYFHYRVIYETVNTLPDMPILGSSNSATKKDMMSKY